MLFGDAYRLTPQLLDTKSNIHRHDFILRISPVSSRFKTRPGMLAILGEKLFGRTRKISHWTLAELARS